MSNFEHHILNIDVVELVINPVFYIFYDFDFSTQIACMNLKSADVSVLFGDRAPSNKRTYTREGNDFYYLVFTDHRSLASIILRSSIEGAITSPRVIRDDVNAFSKGFDAYIASYYMGRLRGARWRNRLSPC